MSKTLRYYSEFRDLEETLWRVEILQEGYAGEASEVTLSGTPLEIEWASADKMAVVQSSSATLQLVSRSDMQFLDMYQVKAGNVRMDVLREGALYWSGTLDPELYEEPYVMTKNYYVSLTFSDFAILEREKWDYKDFAQLQYLLEMCLTKMQIRYDGIVKYVSTQLSASDTTDIFTAVKVNCLNYYDEDDESMSVREVLKETLRPFALRIIQKAGQIYVYDINRLYGAFTPQEVRWRNANAMLSQDVVYNNITVTYSPYGRSSLVDAEVEGSTVSEDEKWSYTLTPDDVATPGFDLYLGDTVVGEIERQNDAKYFRVDPILSGSEDSGVAQFVGWLMPEGSLKLPVKDTEPYTAMTAKLKRPVFVCRVDDATRYRLRVTAEILVDGRVNPYEPWDQGHNDWSDGGFAKYNTIFQQAAEISLKPSVDTIRMSHIYSNQGVWDSSGYEGLRVWETWDSAIHDVDKCRFCYYPYSGRNEEGAQAVGTGWITNKQSIGWYKDDLPRLFEKMGDGEIIPLPPVTGYLDVSLFQKIRMMGQSVAVSNGHDPRTFHLIKNISVELIDAMTYEAIPQEDIETKAWINKDAKEDLSIDTILGTMDCPSPIAKGQLFRTSDTSVIGTMYRAGVTDRLEKLLIGTVYSNYATRHHTLTGDVRIITDFTTLTDKHLPGVYITLQERQDIRSCTSSLQMVTIDTDKYEGA